MRYLLSSGKTTSNKVEYISDLFYIQLSIFSNELPYSNLGELDQINEPTEKAAEDKIRSIINKIIDSTRSKINNTTINIKSIKLVSNTFNVEILIDNNLIKYELEGSN